ncbi:sigma-70 family RNA polymerase sigma factor [Lysinibacillus sp. 54212]|uniref:sigma-70 family RNA polymerase sigma factor n=1 Tax=Lysinibacillus sp. 54212 TaxID=3119829 RepID=UPI002FCB5C8D
MNREAHLTRIMDDYTELLFRVAYYYIKDLHTAEDIVQDVFIKFYHQSGYEERGELKAYLIRITINKCKDYLKSWTYRKISLQQKIFPKQEMLDRNELLQKDEEALIGDAILRLPLKQREPIMYFYLEGMSIKEVANLLNIPENTVKSRLKKGRELLKLDLQHIQWEVLLND